jgi:hypothetical protein
MMFLTLTAFFPPNSVSMIEVFLAKQRPVVKNSLTQEGAWLIWKGMNKTELSVRF